MYRANKNKEDVKYILNNLRLEDLHEVTALNGKNWFKKVVKNIMKSNCIIGKSKKTNKPIVMGGFSSFNNGAAGIWLLCTEEINENYICLLRELRKEIAKYDEEFWITYNIIYKDNFKAKNWLQWLGFKFDNPKPEGIEVPEGFEFFYRLRPVKGLGE